MMWYADKAAFKAGQFFEIASRKDSIGRYSVAIGKNPIASGDYSVALGNYAIAGGWSSVAMGGFEAIARGESSIALSGHAYGSYSVAIKGTATGSSSFAFHGTASGDYSKTFGTTISPSFHETAIGAHNTEYTPKSAKAWDAADRLFVVGNGTDEKNRSNALTILKNGNTTVNGDFRVEGNISSKGDMTVGGNLRVEGSITGNKLEQQVGVVVNTTLNAGATTNISFTFPKAFGAVPMAYVGNITSGGGFAEVVMTLANVTTTGGKLFIYNPKSSSQSPNYTVKIIALGAE